LPRSDNPFISNYLGLKPDLKVPESHKTKLATSINGVYLPVYMDMNTKYIPTNKPTN
jgi:hypothetical protein